MEGPLYAREEKTVTLPLNRQFATFKGRLLMIGFGCVGQGVLPLLLRHIALEPGQIRILDPSSEGARIAHEYGVAFVQRPVTHDNVRDLLARELGPGDFLLNLSVNVGSVDLIGWCQTREVIYLDACIEPWVEGTRTRRCRRRCAPITPAGGRPSPGRRSARRPRWSPTGSTPGWYPTSPSGPY